MRPGDGRTPVLRSVDSWLPPLCCSTHLAALPCLLSGTTARPRTRHVGSTELSLCEGGGAVHEADSGEGRRVQRLPATGAAPLHRPSVQARCTLYPCSTHAGDPLVAGWMGLIARPLLVRLLRRATSPPAQAISGLGPGLCCGRRGAPNARRNGRETRRVSHVQHSHGGAMKGLSHCSC